MDSNIIDSAIDGRYTDFSDNIKSILNDKLNNYPDVIEYKNSFDSIRKMKDLFAGVNSDN